MFAKLARLAYLAFALVAGTLVVLGSAVPAAASPGHAAHAHGLAAKPSSDHVASPGLDAVDVFATAERRVASSRQDGAAAEAATDMACCGQICHVALPGTADRPLPRRTSARAEVTPGSPQVASAPLLGLDRPPRTI